MCARKAECPHYTVIFSRESLQVGLPGRLSSMLGVLVVQNDSCPQRIWRACVRKFTSVKGNIKQLQLTAQTSYHIFTDGSSRRKRTKLRHQRYCRSVTSPLTSTLSPDLLASSPGPFPVFQYWKARNWPATLKSWEWRLQIYKKKVAK